MTKATMPSIGPLPSNTTDRLNELWPRTKEMLDRGGVQFDAKYLSMAIKDIEVLQAHAEEWAECVAHLLRLPPALAAAPEKPAEDQPVTAYLKRSPYAWEDMLREVEKRGVPFTLSGTIEALQQIMLLINHVEWLQGRLKATDESRMALFEELRAKGQAVPAEPDGASWEITGPFKYLHIPTEKPDRWRADLRFSDVGDTRRYTGWGPTEDTAKRAAIEASAKASKG